MNNFCTVIMPDERVCGGKLENRDLGLCATHNRQRIKGERHVPEKQRKPLKPGKPLSSNSTLRQTSSKQRIIIKEKADAVALIGAEVEDRHCVSCGGTYALTPSHVLTEKRFKHHATNPRNILLECQECHNVWEHNKPEAKRLHASWALKMEIISELAPEEMERLKAFRPELYA